jgi:phosphate transport system protein
MPPRADFEEQLKHIQDEVLVIGSLVEKTIHRSVQSLSDRNIELACQVIADDDEIDVRQHELEEFCIDVIARQQPMAGDLRMIVTGLQVASELERIGDYAEGIAKISVRMGDEPPLKPLIDIPRMADISINMLRRSLTALNARDDEIARQVWEDDDQVDQLNEQVVRELVTYMLQDPRNIERATLLMWVSHNLERVADRATNIAERVIYLATGLIATEGQRWSDVGLDSDSDSNGAAAE